MLCIWNPYGLALPNKVTDRCRYCEVVWLPAFSLALARRLPTLSAQKNKKENIPKLLSRYSGITKIYLVVYYRVVLSFMRRFTFLKLRMRLGQQYVIGWKSQ